MQHIYFSVSFFTVYKIFLDSSSADGSLNIGENKIFRYFQITSAISDSDTAWPAPSLSFCRE